MANHWMDQVEAAVVARLTTPPLASVPAANVLAAEEYPREDAKLPGINVDIGDAQARFIGTVNGPSGQMIELEHVGVLTLDIVARGETGLKQTLRTIAKEIEQQLLANPVAKRLGLLRDLELIEFRNIQYDRDTEELTGVLTVQLQFTLRTYEGRPDLT